MFSSEQQIYDKCQSDFLEQASLIGDSRFMDKCSTVAQNCTDFLKDWAKSQHSVFSLLEASKPTLGNVKKSSRQFDRAGYSLHMAQLEQNIRAICKSMTDAVKDFTTEGKKCFDSTITRVMKEYSQPEGVQHQVNRAKGIATDFVDLVRTGSRGISTGATTKGLKASGIVERLESLNNDLLFKDLSDSLLDVVQDGKENHEEAQTLVEKLNIQESGVAGLFELMEELHETRTILQ